MILKRSIHQRDNYKHIHNKQQSPKIYEHTLTELQGEIDSSIIITEDFNTPLSVIDRTTRQTNKEIEDLNTTINELELPNI